MNRALLLLVLVGCRVTPPVATSVDAERGQIALADLQHGRKLMIRKCGNCHRPPLPAEHGIAEWPRILDEMSLLAGLDQGQRHLIERYIIVMAAR